jgi:methionine-rich copper-binding protein CopC
MRKTHTSRVLLRLFFAALVCVLVPSAAFAHAVLESSTPADHSVVHGPSISIVLRYNSRVDARRSTLAIMNAGPSHAKAQLTMEPQKSPSELRAHAHLAPGKYEILWQALATDGHLTRGVVTFTVQ